MTTANARPRIEDVPNWARYWTWRDMFVGEDGGIVLGEEQCSEILLWACICGAEGRCWKDQAPSACPTCKVPWSR